MSDLSNSQPQAAGEAAHTQTPWNFWPDDDNKNLYIVGAGSYPAVVAKTVSNESDDVANVRFIVRACNSHAALMEALKACIQQFEANGDYDDDNKSVLDQANAALQLAE